MGSVNKYRRKYKMILQAVSSYDAMFGLARQREGLWHVGQECLVVQE